MKAATYIAKFLHEKEINTVFELQGGMITHILDTLHKEGDFEIVSMHHEQAAAFAADAYARVTGKPGIALATSGPGATNLITGIGSCYFDSVPALFITGQVNLSEQKGDRGIRQLGFQETDIVEIVKPITKAAYAVKSVTELPSILEKAFCLAMEGRPGPVLIDIPMNIQREEILEASVKESKIDPKPIIDAKNVQLFFNSFLNALTSSTKPLVLVGRGIRASGVTSDLLRLIETANLPLVYSLLGVDNLSNSHPNRVGMIGAYGNRWANYALDDCDLLLVLGSRLDIRQTGADVESFQRNKKIFHVDCESAELNNRVKNCEVLNTDLKDFFNYALSQKIPALNTKEWFCKILEKKRKYPDTEELKEIEGINPNLFIHSLSKKAKNIKAYTTDVGNNQMWAAQSVELLNDQLFLSCGGMGAMGYSLPAAIGASFALNKASVIAISGDGGFQINIQELQTIFRNKLPIKIVILNNQSLGMIRQFQDSYFDSCYQSSVWGYSAPDFANVAKAYGINGISIDKPDQIEDALNIFFKDEYEPMLLNVNINTFANAYPKLAFGMPLSKMEPLIE